MSINDSAGCLKRAGLASLGGCNIETIRYYEKIGLMPDPPRSAAGYRLYGEHHVMRLRFILRARELGFSTADIRGLLAPLDDGTQTCARVKARTEQHLAQVRRKIADLKRIERVLAQTAQQCTGSEVRECPILQALTA